MRLGHRLDGASGRPLLVLSPALGTTTALWDRQLSAFAARFRVLRLDHPGHGESPPPEGPVLVEEIGRSVLELLDGLGVERASFCGVSLGGMVGMWLGANAPERIERLVLACTGAKVGERDDYVARAALVRRAGAAAIVEGARERWFTGAFRDTPAARRILEELGATPAEGYAACCEAAGAFDFRGELPRVGVPTLVVYGEEDPVTPPAVAEGLAAGIPGAERAGIAGAAHLANVERAEAFTAVVLQYLERGEAA